MTTPRAAAPFRRLLAALLLVQAVLAPALCLAGAAAPAGGGATAVEVCTAEGLRALHLAPGEGDEAPAQAGHGGVCLACHALPQAAAPDAPVLPAPAWTLAKAPAAAANRPAPPPPIRGPPSGPRAPPTLLS